MSDNALNYNINVGGNATSSVGNIKKELRLANAELIAAQKNFGDYSTEALQAAKKVAQLRDSVQEARETSDLFDPGKKFQAFSGALTAVAGGFAAVQGAIGLFGGESKELEKQLLKVQSALALSQGLSTITDSAKDFQRLGSIIKTQVVTAFSTLRGAIIATGVGALAVGLGLLIANFDKVKKVVLNLLPGLGAVADFIGKLVNKVTDFIGVTSEAGRATAKLIEDNEKAIKEGDRFLELNADKYDEYTQRKIKANLEFKKKQNEFLKDESLTEDERNKLTLQAREKSNREILKSDKDREDNRRKVSNESAKKNADLQKQKDEAEKQRLKEKDIRESAAQKVQIDAFRATLSEREQITLQAEDELEKKKATLIIAGNFNFELIEEEHRLKLAAINDKFNKEDEDKRLEQETKKKEIDDLNKAREKETLELNAVTLQERRSVELANLNTEYNEKLLLAIQNGEDILALRELYAAKETAVNRKFAKEQKDIDNTTKQSKINTLNEVALVLGAFATLSGEQTKANKAFTLAQIGIDTASAISSLTKSSEANPANPATFGAAGAIQFATGLIRILANIKKAKTLLFSPSSTPSASAPSAGSLSSNAPVNPQGAGVATTNISQQSINALGNQAIKAYVVETDITASQQRIQAIQQRARFS